MCKRMLSFMCSIIIIVVTIAAYTIPSYATNDNNDILTTQSIESTTGSALEICGASPGWSPTENPMTMNDSDFTVSKSLYASETKSSTYTFHTSVFTFSDIVVFSYYDDTSITITNSNGNEVKSDILGADQYMRFTGSAGIYTISGSKSFTVLVGDALSQGVQGYFAVDQSGKGTSTLLNTYMVGNSFGKERFIVFAYEDGTEFTIKSLNGGTILYAGSLDKGQHYTMPTTPYRNFLQVSSNKPVSALSYGDQDYYVPSSNGTFTGDLFYGYSGYIGSWTNSITVTSYYDDNQVTVSNSVTGEVISEYTLGKGQVHSDAVQSETYWKVESSKPVTAANIPFAGFSGNYAYMTRSIDQTGAGAGRLFYVPTIGSRIDVFSFEDDNNVTITKLGSIGSYPYTSTQVIFSGQLNSGEEYAFRSDSGQYVYKVEAGKNVSVLQSNSSAGADFMPLSYAQALPDLGVSPSDIQFGAEIKNCTPGDLINVEVTVHNYGPISADNILVSVYDGDPDGGGIAPVIATSTIKTLPGGSSTNISFKYTVPLNPEFRSIAIKIDPDGAIVESSKSNNKAVKPLIPNKDLLPPLSVNITAPAGLMLKNKLLEPNPFTISADIFNTGTVDATDVRIELKLLDGLSLRSGNLITNVTRLSPSGKLRLTWEVEADPGVSGINRYQLNVSAKNAESKNVNRSVNVPDIVSPDKPVKLKANAASGGDVELSWMANSEKDLAGYKIFYGTSKTKLDGKGAVQGDSPIIISAFNEYMLSGLKPGITYYFAIKAYDMSGNESDYSDIVSCKVTPAGSPDLEATGIKIENADGSALTKYYQGKNMRVYAEIKNSGTTKFTGNVKMVLNVNGKKALERIILVSLDAGSTNTEEITTYYPYSGPPNIFWTIPNNPSNLNLEVELQTTEAELSTSNNTFSKTITTHGKPNLEVYAKDFEIPQSYSKAGKTADAKIKVENSGGSESGAFDVVIKKSDGTTVATMNVKNIKNGSSQNVTIPLTLESTSGEYAYRVDLMNLTNPDASFLDNYTGDKIFEVGVDDNEDTNNDPAGAVEIKRTTNDFTEIFVYRKYKDIKSYIHKGDEDWYKIKVVDDEFLLVSLLSPYVNSGSTVIDENYIVELYKEGKYAPSDAVAQSISSYTRNYFRYEIKSPGTYYIRVLPKSSSSDYSVEHAYTLETGIEMLEKIYGSEGEGWQTKDTKDYVTKFPISFSMGTGMKNKWGTVNGNDITYEDFFSDFVVDSQMRYNGSMLEKKLIYEDSAFDIWNDASIYGAPSVIFDIKSSSSSTMLTERRTDSVGGWCSVASNGKVTIAYNQNQMDQSNISMPTSFTHEYEFFKTIIAHELGHAIGLRDLYVRASHGYNDKSGNLINNTDKLMYGYNNWWTIAPPKYLSSKDIYGLEMIQRWRDPVALNAKSAIFASYVGYGEDELYSDSEVIARIKVNKVEDYCDSGLPTSLVSGDVISYYKDKNNDHSSTISFIQEGNSTHNVYSNRLLEVGDEVILFLKKSDPNSEYFIMGGPQGRYNVYEMAGKTMVDNHLENYIDDEMFFIDVTQCKDTAQEISVFENEVNNRLLMSKPQMNYSISPEANKYGWHNQPVTVEFSAEDEMYDITYVSEAVRLEQEGSNQYATGMAKNAIGQSNSIVVSGIDIDMTSPEVALNSEEISENVWYNSDINLGIRIVEELSGIQSLEYQTNRELDYNPEGFLDATGKNLEITDEGIWYFSTKAVDKADNVAVQTFGPFLLDKTRPVIEYLGKTECSLRDEFEVDFSASDNLSGVASTDVYIDELLVDQNLFVFNEPGKHEIKIIAKDNAGNTTELIQEVNVLLPVSVSITPESINLKSGQNGQAQITVNLMFPDGYDVNKIIAGSISINGSVYAESSEKYGYVKNPVQYNKNGNASYMVKFYRSDLSKILSPGKNHVVLRGKTADYDFVWEGNITAK